MKRYVTHQSHLIDLDGQILLVSKCKSPVALLLNVDEIQNINRELLSKAVIDRDTKVAWKVICPKSEVERLRQQLIASEALIDKIKETDQRLEVLFEPQTNLLRVRPWISTEPTIKMVTKIDTKGRLKLLVVDDSPTIRGLIKKIAESENDFIVVGETGDPREVDNLIRTTAPDLMTLDIHMPHMNGVSLIKKLFPMFRLPTVMVTSVGIEDGPLVMEALEGGAVDYVQKPSFDELKEMAPLILEKLKAAVKANMNKAATFGEVCLLPISSRLDKTKVLAIGASTRGTEAIKSVLTQMPAEIPPTVIVQHIPEGFSKSFADRLNMLCPFEVREAVDGDLLKPGLVLIAPGGKHMLLVRTANGLAAKILDTDPVNRHKPSVDVLFDSVAELCGKKAVGVILTGMGGDGAKGLRKIRDTGAKTLVQSEKTCVVFGMPKEAIKHGGADLVVDLEEIPHTLTEWLQQIYSMTG